MQSPDSAIASTEVLRFVRSAAEPGLQCMAWLPAHETFVDARLRIGQDQLELQTLGTGTPPVKICLGYLRSACVASKAQIPYPSGLSVNWVDFAVFLEFFDLTEAMELRTECVLLSGDVEASLLCRSLGQLQRFGVPPLEKEPELPAWVAAQARAAVATLTSPDVLIALKRWRAGSALQPSRLPVHRLRTSSEVNAGCTGLSLSTLWKDATAGVLEILNSPALLGTKPDPSLAAGWDAPLPLHGGDRLDGEAELSARWKKVMGDRDPAELTRSELRALFVLGHRIPWQYRLALWPAWLHVAEEGSDPLDDGMLCTEETCKRQIEKDVPRTRPADLNESQRAALGRVLRAFAVLRPQVGYCQGLNFVAAVALLVGFTEKQALGGLRALTDVFCSGYYEESMSGLLRDIAVLDALLLHLLPKIHARFAEVDLPLIWIATEPLLTLFSRELKPIEPRPKVEASQRDPT
ncbi:unnamed protein product [Symbiodinium natans]|uniref:Rab-GAP TBC domain-containing protein n=1 Tax=Symbiodinium natans TaxID=878477 RepID=A0A812L2T9_9DINO|nr:unnamed protein product [Symbiodinium natans]